LYGSVGRVKVVRPRCPRLHLDPPAAAGGVLPLGFHRGKLSLFSFEKSPNGMDLIRFGLLRLTSEDDEAIARFAQRQNSARWPCIKQALAHRIAQLFNGIAYRAGAKF
jgi:hypothetical protein